MARVLDTATVFVAVGAVFVAVAMLADLVASIAVRVPSPNVDAPRPAVVLSASPTPAPSALPSPTPTNAPAITATRYVSGGHPYAGLEVPAGTVVAAPLDGVVEVKTYQLIGGSVRVGSNVSTLPFYPYITVVSVDRRMTYRPGELGADVEVLVVDGQQVRAGAPLFRQLGTGRSSWATFYDPAAPFQVVVSLQAVPSGLDLDPLTFF
jgi:hypothetical protein